MPSEYQALHQLSTPYPPKSPSSSSRLFVHSLVNNVQKPVSTPVNFEESVNSPVNSKAEQLTLAILLEDLIKSITIDLFKEGVEIYNVNQDKIHKDIPANNVIY